MTTLTKSPQAFTASPAVSRQAAISTFLAMVRKEFTVMLRYPVEFVASFAQIFLIIVVIVFAGLMFSPNGVESSDSDSYAGAIVAYGFVLFIFLSDTLWTIGYNLRREQKQGTLEQLYLSPASKFASLAARVALTLVWTGLLSIAAVMVIGLLLGSLPMQNLPLAAYVLLFSLAGTFGTGFAFAALTMRIKDAAQTAANGLQFAFMIFCAPFFPFAALPPFVLAISKLIPLSYSVDLFRSALIGFPAGTPELASVEIEFVIVTLFGIIMPVLGYWLFRKAENQARRKGTLSEF